MAIWISHRARGDGKRSADASERSASAAEHAAEDGRRSADAAARSADIAEEALDLQRQAAQPKVALIIRQAGRGIYVLQNNGDAPACGLTLMADDAGLVDWSRPFGGILPPGDSREFIVRSPANAPARLRFTWDGQPDPAHIPMPRL